MLPAVLNFIKVESLSPGFVISFSPLREYFTPAILTRPEAAETFVTELF